MQLELNGKSALVTGSSRGIGRAIATGLLREGCRVALNGRNARELEDAARALGGKNLTCVVGDVTRPEEARRIVADVLAAFGKLDVLVCNVGSGGSVRPGEESFDEWQRVFALNLWSATNMVEAARDALAASKGVIVCVSSICGMEVVPGAPVTYSAAKAALNAYVRGIARPRSLARRDCSLQSARRGKALPRSALRAARVDEHHRGRIGEREREPGGCPDGGRTVVEPQVLAGVQLHTRADHREHAAVVEGDDLAGFEDALAE